MQKKVLLVCLGNICRSPTAEAILRVKAETHKLNIHVDSAGTAGYHIGERSDIRSIKHAERRGYQMTHLARQLSASDFENFDHVIVMDESNFSNASVVCPPHLSHKLEKMAHYDPRKVISHIPDPYYFGPEEFERVINYLEICVDGFIQKHFKD